MALLRIICVGNRFVPEDSLGPRVYDHLRAEGLPSGVELVDGGLRGLDLLDLIEDQPRVVFVDAFVGEPGDVTVHASGAELIGPGMAGGHGGGLAYLLAVLPHVCEGPPPAWVVVGAAGRPDDALVAKVAARALSAALGEAP